MGGDVSNVMYTQRVVKKQEMGMIEKLDLYIKSYPNNYGSTASYFLEENNNFWVFLSDTWIYEVSDELNFWWDQFSSDEFSIWN